MQNGCATSSGFGPGRWLAQAFPYSRFLSPEAATSLLPRLAGSGIADGAVYDALVGASAAEHGILLGTPDPRALETYRALDIRTEFFV